MGKTVWTMETMLARFKECEDALLDARKKSAETLSDDVAFSIDLRDRANVVLSRDGFGDQHTEGYWLIKLMDHHIMIHSLYMDFLYDSPLGDLLGSLNVNGMMMVTERLTNLLNEVAKKEGG